MATLKVLNGLAQGQEVSLEGEVFFIGREGGNHLILPDRMVSRKHAVIHSIDGEFVLSDLKSLKGVWIEGEKVEEIALQEGMEFRLGDIRVVFSHQGRKPRVGGTGAWGKAVAVIFCVALLGSLALWYFFMRTPTVDSEIDRWYQQGIVFWNQHRDYENAQKAWKHVLELDVEHKTPQGEKASKLLEMLEKMKSVDLAPPPDR